MWTPTKDYYKLAKNLYLHRVRVQDFDITTTIWLLNDVPLINVVSVKLLKTAG